MTDDFTLRLATPDDAAAVRRIYAPFVADTPITFEQEVPPADDLRGRIEETLPGYPWLVCERDGRVVGYAYAGPVRKRAAYQWSVELSVYVDPDAQRRGVARALYTALLGLLAEQGYRNAFAVMTRPNGASAAFHESFGFESAGVLAAAGYKNGDWHDVEWLQRRLGDAGPDDDPDDDDPPEPPRSLDALPDGAVETHLRAGEDRFRSA